MNKVRLVPLALLLAALSLSSPARADTLADRAPADAIGFMSWSGTDALGKAYDGSKLKGMLDALNLPELIMRHQAEALKGAGDSQSQADRKAVADWVQAAIKSPTAVYFGPMDFANADEPQFKVAIYSEVGKEKAAAFAEQINAMIGRAKKEKYPPLAAVAAGDYILLTLGSVPEMEKRLTGPAPADGLANTQPFQQTMAQVGAASAPSAFLWYMDGEATVKLIGDAITAKGGMGADMWPNISDAMGLSALRHIAAAGNFDGPNWRSQTFIGLAEKRKGYMILLDTKPLSDDVLKLIPKNVTCAGVIRFDGPRIFHEIREAVGSISPQNGQQAFDAGMQQFFAFTGVDLLKDLLQPLGDSYALYAVADSKGDSLKNAVIVSKLNDAAKAESSLTTLESVVNTMIQQRDANAVEFKTEYLPAPNDKVTAHEIIFPAASPCWGVANGDLYVAMSLAGLEDAVANGSKNGAITDNPDFVDLWKKVGHKDMSGFAFLDLPKLAAEFYPLAAKAIEKEHADHPDAKDGFTLPALDKITPNLGPVLSVYWTDKDGYHSQGAGPLPLLEMIRPESLLQMMVFAKVAEKPAAAAPDKNMP